MELKQKTKERTSIPDDILYNRDINSYILNENLKSEEAKKVYERYGGDPNKNEYLKMVKFMTN